jgi:hypothetical protein
VAGRRTLGQFAFHVYAALYVAILGLGVLRDLAGASVRPETVPLRAAAVAGIALVGILAAAGWTGRTAVALRTTPAELQLSLLSPAPRPKTLQRTFLAGLGISSTITAALGLVLMVLSPAQFGGLPLAGRFAFLTFSAGTGALAFGVHVLVAERRGKPLTIAGIAVAATLLADALRRHGQSMLTSSVRGVVTKSPLPALVGVLGLAGVAGWIAWRQAERLPLERIATGTNLSDGASVAFAGNDVRSLALILRRFGASPRPRPLFSVPGGFALRFPMAARSLRSVARWRLGRWMTVLALTALVTALLTSGAPSTERAALAALLLWALGLTFQEPLAQEHDRRDRLNLLPNAKSVELRAVGFGFLLTFVVLGAAFGTQIRTLSAVYLAVAATAAATVASTLSLRSTWKLLIGPEALGMPPEAIAGQVLFRLSRPGVVGFLCLTTWRLGSSGIVVVLPGSAILVALAAAIGTDNFERLRVSR